MPILHIALVIVVCGFLLYLVNRYIPMAAGLKNLLNIVVIVGIVIWLVTILLGVLGPGPSIG